MHDESWNHFTPVQLLERRLITLSPSSPTIGLLAGWLGISSRRHIDRLHLKLIFPGTWAGDRPATKTHQLTRLTSSGTKRQQFAEATADFNFPCVLKCHAPAPQGPHAKRVPAGDILILMNSTHLRIASVIFATASRALTFEIVSRQ